MRKETLMPWAQGRPLNQSRQLALLSGDKTYTGGKHARCGTTERYVKGGGCVHCARMIATEQRDARKFLAQAAAETPASRFVDVNQTSEVELDAAEEIAIEDAAARFEADIESLM